jgi:hypothetical protein
MAVQQFALKGILPCKVRHEGVAQVPRRHHDRVELFFALLLVPALRLHPPPPGLQRLAGYHARAEPDMPLQPEMRRELLQVPQKLGVVEVLPVPRRIDREIGEGGGVTARVDHRPCVDGGVRRLRGVRVVAPAAADVVLRLEADGLETLGEALLDGGEAADA